VSTKSHFLARLLSMLTGKFVKTGQGFTTSDDSLEIKKPPARKLGMAKYRASSRIRFIIVGGYIENGKNVVRLYDEETKTTYSVEKELFDRLFKLV